MILEQFYLGCLSQASYLVADETSGRAVVVDPRRDVEPYLVVAGEHGLRIELVVLTHVHADFVPGHVELAARTGAEIAMSEIAPVGFPFRGLRDGETIRLGEVSIEVLATPGHTPESITLAVRERAADRDPVALLTGDTLFLGDVGRPDLLGAAGRSAADMARELYRSLRTRILPLPDDVRIYPGHGAGSSCGKALSSATVSTLGEQRAVNYALAPMTEDEFVAVVTEGLGEPPAYFADEVAVNRAGHRPFDPSSPLPELAAGEAVALAVSVELYDYEPQSVELDDVAVKPVECSAVERLEVGNPRVDTPGVDISGVELSNVGFRKVELRKVDPRFVELTKRDPREVEFQKVEFENVELNDGELNDGELNDGELNDVALHGGAGGGQGGRGAQALLLDVRDDQAFAAGHLHGAVNVGLSGRFAEYAAAVHEPGQPVVLVGAPAEVAEARVRLARVGIDAVRGAVTRLAVDPALVGPSDRIDAAEAARRITADPALQVVDVRNPGEFDGGSLPRAVNLPLPRLRTLLDRIDPRRPVLVHCAGGYRSSAAASLLRAHGFAQVTDLLGGWAAWQSAAPTVLTTRS